MGRYLAMDFGVKRTGLAVSDASAGMAFPLTCVPTEKVWDFLKTYLKEETIEAFVLGLPLDLRRRATHASAPAKAFGLRLQRLYPDLPLHWVDERFTSAIAKKTLMTMGLPKKKRQEKTHINTLSATLLLQTYLARKEGLKENS